MPTTFLAALRETWPRQHGAWTILAASSILGLAAAGTFTAPCALLATSVLSGFLARQAVQSWLGCSGHDPRRQPILAVALTYLALCAVTGLWLAFAHELWILLPIGVGAALAAALCLALSLEGRRVSLGVDLVGLLGLSLIAPAFEYVATGTFSERSLALWFLCALFFSGRPFQVRFFTRHRTGHSSLRQRVAAGWPTLAYQLASLTAATWLAAASPAVNPPLVVLAFLPVLALAVLSVAKGPSTPLSIWKIGYLEGSQAVLFVLFASLAFRLA